MSAVDRAADASSSSTIPAPFTAHGALCLNIDTMLLAMHFYEILLAIALAPSYIPGGARSFWKFLGVLLQFVGFLIALWLIWLLLRWAARKLAAAFRKK